MPRARTGALAGRSETKLCATLLAAALVLALPVPVVADQCPSDIRRIDTAMAGAKLFEEQVEAVTRLRDEGQRLHDEGKHQEAMEALAKAKQALGLL